MPVARGLAEVVRDLDDPDGWLLYLDGVPSSYVDLADPTNLVFEYVRWIGDVLDLLAPEGEPLYAVHLGGGGATLPRYLAHTRPSSRQVVVEVDPAVVALARERFGVRSTGHLRVRTGDAREVLGTLREASYDVVVRDAFDGPAVPAHLRTNGFLQAVRRVLRPAGTYVANLTDRPPLPVARAEVGTALAAFEHVALVGEPSVFRGRRYGNLVLLASDARLPVAGLTRRLASGAVPARLVHGAAVRSFTGGAAILRDDASD